MRKFRHFFPFLPLVLGVSESFVLVPSPSPKRSTSAANLHRHLASSPLSSATGSGSNYISFSADTGFLVSPSAFHAILDRFELRKRIGILLNHDLETTDTDELAEVGSHARELILNAGLPTEVEIDIHNAYSELCKDTCSAENQYPSVQVRAAPSNLWPDSAFAGHQASMIDVRGIEDVTTAVLECFATIFSDAAIAYRANHGIDHFGVHGAIAVSRMDVARRAWAPVDDTNVSVVDAPRPDKGFRDVTIMQHHSFRPRA